MKIQITSLFLALAIGAHAQDKPRADEELRQEMIKKIEQSVRDLEKAWKPEKAAAHARRLAGSGVKVPGDAAKNPESGKILDGKKARKLEVRHSMLGFRNTLRFYTFKDQQAILVLSIGNKDETFPVTGKVHLFPDATTGEELKNWINNQHSDALFPDIPEPTFTGELPKGTCKVTSHKQTGLSKNPGPGKGAFKDFKVELSVKAYALDKKFKLPAFTDTARVHVESK